MFAEGPPARREGTELSCSVARFLPVLAAALLVPRAARSAPAQEPVRALSVAIAANLKPAFDEIVPLFRARNPGVEVKVTVGASGALHAQLQNGAPFDLFLSADVEFPGKLAAAGLTTGPATIYALGKLVVWVPNGSNVDVERAGLAALRDPSVRKIAVANPQVAPYGRAAVEALRAAKLLDALEPRFVLGQSVAQVAQFAQSGNAQAAFLPLSLAVVPPLSKEGRHVAVPGAPPVPQALVVLRSAKDPALAKELADFVRGPESRAILAKLGYGLP